MQPSHPFMVEIAIKKTMIKWFNGVNYFEIVTLPFLGNSLLDTNSQK